MDFAKRYPLLTTIIAVCVVAFLVELFFLWKFSSNVSVAEAQLKSSRSKAESAAKQTPAPSQDNLDAATKNVMELKAELADVDHTLQDTPLKIDDIPTKDFDLLSKITSYQDKLNQMAKDKNVLLPTGDYTTYTFGMSLYLGRGVTAPPPEKFAAVFKQVKVLEYILSHLMEDAKLPDQKMKITAIQREDVTAVVGVNGATVAPTDTGTTSDFFSIPPTITARVPGAINTLAFRIQFVAYSDSLRILLNDLAKFELPLVVRSIDVQPAESDKALNGVVSARAAAAAAADTSTRKPVITDNFSQFTIVVEYIELPAPPKPAETDGTATDGATPAGTATATASGTAAAATGTAKAK